MKSYTLLLEKARTSNQSNTKTLNPKLFTEQQEMKTSVRNDILRLAGLYAGELGLNKDDVEGVNIVGGNASYDFSPESDLDMTMVLKPNAEMSRKRFKALSKLTSMLNYERHPKIRGIDTNVFVSLRGLNNPIRSQSIYSVTDDEWIQEPSEKEENNQRLVMSKVQEFVRQIRSACDDDDLSCHRALLGKIKAFRARGLKKGGEYSFAAEVYKNLSRSGEVDKIKEHIAELTRTLYQFEQSGELPERLNTTHIPLSSEPMSLVQMEEFCSEGKPTNRSLWMECMLGAESNYQGDNQAVVYAEALNSYYIAQGRWEMEQGEPAYLSVDINRVQDLTENTSRKLLQNITGSILNEMADSTFSVTSRRVLKDVARRGDDTSVGWVQQECVHGESGVAMRCECCNLRFFHRTMESIYRENSPDVLEHHINHLASLSEIVEQLEN